jgi:hypothetical protein
MRVIVILAFVVGASSQFSVPVGAQQPDLSSAGPSADFVSGWERGWAAGTEPQLGGYFAMGLIGGLATGLLGAGPVAGVGFSPWVLAGPAALLVGTAHLNREQVHGSSGIEGESPEFERGYQTGYHERYRERRQSSYRSGALTGIGIGAVAVAYLLFYALPGT